MNDVVVNKIAGSGLITLNLEDFFPGEKVLTFDLKDYLFMEVMLKEKEFREAMKNIDWNDFSEKNIALYCSADAIVPLWAYMLVASYLRLANAKVWFGDNAIVSEKILLKNLQDIPVHDFEGKRVVIKGCGDKTIPAAAYTEVTQLLAPYVKSLMYGEPCSTVPIFKRK